MAAASVRWVSRAVLGFGLALLLNGLPLNGAVRAEDEKKEKEKKEEKNPLREELLKLNSVTGEDAQRAKLRALVKDKEKAKKLVAEASKMMKEAKGKEEKPLNYNGMLLVARTAHYLKQYDVAEPFYEQLIEAATSLKSGSKMLQAYDGLIDMYWDNKKYSLVVDTCEKYMDVKGPKEFEEAKPFVLERLIQAKAKEEKYDEALRMAQGLIELDEGGWYFKQLKGWIQREQGKFDGAIETYNDVLESIDANKNLKAEDKDKLKDRVRYTLTGLHVENKQIDKAAKQLQTLIKRNPDNATYKNDLGFIWVDHDMNLEESEKLIKEAIDLDKKEKEKLKKDGKIDEVRPNAAYLDSLGWVYFKQKKYKEALELLKQAAADEDDGNHMEIWDHLADCHLAMGQKKEAVAAWEKALKMEDLSKRDGERRRKVSEKLKKARGEVVKD